MLCHIWQWLQMNDRQHLELINGTIILLVELYNLPTGGLWSDQSSFVSLSSSLVKGYFQYAGGFEPRKAFDITAKVPDNQPHDPMFIVEAVKSKNI
jgi:hypothetical protein